MWFLQSNLNIVDVLIRILSVLVIIFTVLPLHECAHGWVAYKLGDNTAKYSGRLTLNPLPHIDPLGALGILLFGFGWAKPVPVDARYFKNPKAGMAITALAGPVSNLLAAFLGYVIFNVVGLFADVMSAQVYLWIYIFFNSYVSINIGLAVFNLLPLPPLDGSKIFAAFIPNRMLYKYYQYENYIMIIVFVLLFTGVLSTPLNYLSVWVGQGISWLAALPFKWFS